MRFERRKGLADIRTRSSMTSDAENPQRTFLHLACLELRKTLCRKVRDAARGRAAEMDRKIAELDGQASQILDTNQTLQEEASSPTAAPHWATDPGTAGKAGMRVKY